MTNELSKDAEQLLMQFQLQNQQLENLMVQKQTLMFQKNEVESAIKEFETGKEFYKIAGPIIVKKDKEDLKKELDDKLEEIDVMLSSVEKNEKKLRELVMKNRDKLQEMLPMLKEEHEEHEHDPKTGKCNGCK
jgi:prefoldin beta subunit